MWQPIESAPAVGKKRLLFWLAAGRAAVGYKIAKSQCARIDGQVCLATHWMPLPPPPTDQPAP